MPHVRTQIRHRVRNALRAGLDDAAYDVDASRKSARNQRYPVTDVNIKVLNDQVRELETMYGSIPTDIHVMSLYIRVSRTGNGDTLDDLLDEDEIKINTIIMTLDWLDLCEEDPKPVQTNFTSDGDGEKDFAELVLRYDFEYRVSRNDLETPVA